MKKLLIAILSCIWISCGSIPQKTPNKKASSNETDTVKNMIKDTIIHNDNTINDSEEVLSGVRIDSLITSQSKDVQPEKPEPNQKEFSKPNHTLWNTLLNTYVNTEGNVDFKNFLNKKLALEQYLNHLADTSPEEDWPKNEILAYYINLYNAATVKLIIDNYPTKSIKDIKDPWGKAWVKVGTNKLSLGAIEHKILRKMNEPRIHFAINCASFSCPKLLNKAFTAALIETQFDKVTTEFINDPSKNVISSEKMYLSQIFKWYKKDFTENGSLIDFIKPYTEVKIDANTGINFSKYDWNLNEAK